MERQAENTPEASEVSSEEDNDLPQFFGVKVSESGEHAKTEQDVVWERCTALAAQLRRRPTLPASWEDASISWENTSSGYRLPLYSCPFKQCHYGTDDRCAFLLHLGGETSPHRAAIEDICSPASTPWLKRIDYVNGAISVHERAQWPRLGWP